MAQANASAAALSSGAKAKPDGEHERTVVVANAAFQKLRALRQKATPRNFEIWYAYATNSNPSLNQTINDRLTRNGALADADLEKIGAHFVSTSDIADRIDTVSSRIDGEIRNVVATMDTAVGSTSARSWDLDRVSETLSTINKREDLTAVVKDLMRTLHEMTEINRTLETELRASKSQIEQLRKNLDTIRDESRSDPLTGLMNRRTFDGLLSKMLSATAKSHEPLALIMGDIDHFRIFNDTCGHLTGDRVLQLVASLLKETFKDRGTVARYGGEEFAMLLPKSDLVSARAVAEEIRRAVMSKVVIDRSTSKNLGRVMMSLGVACIRATDNATSLLERADACLTAAKRNGRNRVVSETDPEFVPAGTATRVA
jgi:diguanylate cyclase